MKIKLNGEYTEAELLQMIEESKKKKQWFEELPKGEWGVNFYTGGEFIADEALKCVKNIYSFSRYEEAELMAERLNLQIEMYQFAKLRNEGWVADCNSDTQLKFGIEIYKNMLEVEDYYTTKCFISCVAVKSKEIAEEMLEIFGERIKKAYEIH